MRVEKGKVVDIQKGFIICSSLVLTLFIRLPAEINCLIKKKTEIFSEKG